MDRRSFVKTSALAAGFLATGSRFQDPVIGHGDFRYTVRLDWGKQAPGQYPVNDCHEMALSKNGHIYLVTNDTHNNVLVFNKDGKVLQAWGTDLPGAHGLTLVDEGGTDMLYIADFERHEVLKYTTNGRLVQTFGYPADTGKYTEKNQFKPTETAVAPNGDVYVADGYGEDWIIHYGPNGVVKNIFGGKSQADNPGWLSNAHGIALDTRRPGDPQLLVTSRAANQVKSFSLSGVYQSTIDLHGAYICRPVVQGTHLFFAVLVSQMPWDSQSGFVCILDQDNKVISCPGGNLPPEGITHEHQPLYQTIKVFQHPHDVLPDTDGNLYVAQWNAGKVYPARLERYSI